MYNTITIEIASWRPEGALSSTRLVILLVQARLSTHVQSGKPASGK